ncbi:MAG: flagellin, partial [Candidatus Palauibacterales bacterium]|nr:flagellin [Candidatus Palauibacterales bacterium]
IQDEFSNLQDEIGRIVDTTKFQGSKLLDGSFGASLEAGDDHDGDTTGASDIDDGDDFGDDILNKRAAATGTSFGEANGTSGDFGVSDLEFGETGHFRIDTTTGTTGGTATFTVSNTLTGAVSETFQLTSTDTTGTAQVDLEAFDLSISVSDKSEFANEADTSNTGDAGTGIEIDINEGNGTFLVSGNAEAGPSGAGTIQLSGSDLDLTTDTLGEDPATTAEDSIDQQSLSTRSDAESAIESIDRAINDVSESLGTIGASMNRIGFAKSNTETAIENFSAAESVIRDVDIASETTRFSRLQIQQQAATSMLAQANSAPQQVLGLIQG